MSRLTQSRWLAQLSANPRLRGGVWFIAGILWFSGYAQLQELADSRNKEYLSSLKRIARLELLVGQTDWDARSDKMQERAKLLIEKLWQEKTQGLAQATFQDTLNQLLQQGGIAKPQISVAVQSDERSFAGGIGPLWKVSAKVAFEFNPKTYMALVEKIATAERQIVIESVNIKSNPNPRVDLLLVAYFRAPAQ